MNFKEFIIEARFKDFHAIFVGRLQPATLGHAEVIKTMLKKKFKSVNIALSKNSGDSRNPLSITDRKMQIKSVFPNINVAGVETKTVFGMYLPDEDEEIRKLFKIKDNDPLVIVLGKEDSRFGIISKRPQFFIVNKNEEPSANSPSGVFGIKLKKLKLGDNEKISATTVRNAILSGDDETALKMMIGDNSTKKKIINKIRKNSK